MCEDGTASVYQDRKTLLFVLGMVLVILGGFLVAGVVFSLVGTVLPALLLPAGEASGMSVPWPTALPGAGLNLFRGAVLIAAGVGSIRARRWAPRLAMAYMGVILCLGIATCVTLPALTPFMHSLIAETVPPQGNIPGMLIGFVLLIVLGYTLVFQVGFPALFLYWYQLAGVRETCARRDPRPHWSEDTPVPVLATALMLAWMALVLLVMMLTMPMVLMPSGMLFGNAARVILLPMAAVAGLLAWGVSRRAPVSWTALFVLYIAYSAFMLASLRHLDLAVALEELGYPAQLIQIFEAHGDELMQATLLPMWILGVAAFIFLLYLKRFFRRERQRGDSGAEV